ncbi:MAG: hypothetical protein AB1894_14860 [Chloroflexota bacterium]
MKSPKILPLVLLLFVALLAVACSQQATPAQPPTETVNSAPTAEAILQTPTEAVLPTGEPTEAPAPTKSADLVDYCLECHIDKQALIDNARPEEEVISENEGAG